MLVVFCCQEKMEDDCRGGLARSMYLKSNDSDWELKIIRANTRARLRSQAATFTFYG